jgi:hypothetical protein
MAPPTDSAPDSEPAPATYYVGQRVLIKLSDPRIRKLLGIPDTEPVLQLAQVVAPPQLAQVAAYDFKVWFYGVLIVGRRTPWQAGIACPQDYFLTHESDMRPAGAAPFPMLGSWGVLETLFPGGIRRLQGYGPSLEATTGAARELALQLARTDFAKARVLAETEQWVQGMPAHERRDYINRLRKAAFSDG